MPAEPKTGRGGFMVLTTGPAVLVVTRRLVTRRLVTRRLRITLPVARIFVTSTKVQYLLLLGV